MALKKHEEVLKLYSEAIFQKTYKLNPKADVGINPQESVLHAICSTANIKSPVPQNQALTDLILKSYLSKYISTGSLKSQNPFDLEVGCDGKEFILTLTSQNDKGLHGEQDSTIIYVGVSGNLIYFDSYNLEYLNFINEEGSFGEFLLTGFKGEAFNRTILAPTNNGLKVGVCSGSCDEKGTSIEVTGNVFTQNWDADCEFNQLYKCQLPKEEDCLNIFDVAEINEALNIANQSIDSYIKGQPATQQNNFGNNNLEA